jgi:hypothetical protein
MFGSSSTTSSRAAGSCVASMAPILRGVSERLLLVS